MNQRARILRRNLAKAVLRRSGPALLKALARTWKTQVLGEEHLAEAMSGGRGHFMALWHGRMIVALPYHGERDWQVLVSPSDDGDISEHLLESFGYGVLRGSTSRTGARSLRAMRKLLERGEVLVVTPDGPRGPQHSMNLGLAWLARATGAAIVPCGFVCDRAWHARSWDRFTIPKPRARLALVYGPPLRVARNADAEVLEVTSQDLRERMLAAEQRGFDTLGVEGRS